MGLLAPRHDIDSRVARTSERNRPVLNPYAFAVQVGPQGTVRPASGQLREGLGCRPGVTNLVFHVLLHAGEGGRDTGLALDSLVHPINHDRLVANQRFGIEAEHLHPVCTSQFGLEVGENAGRLERCQTSGWERLRDAVGFNELLHSRAIDIVQPELLQCGGVQGLLNVSAAASAYGGWIAPHNAQSPFTTVVNAHVGAASRSLLVQETFDDFLEPWSRDILTGSAIIRDGYIELPGGPGFGVALSTTQWPTTLTLRQTFFAGLARAGSSGPATGRPRSPYGARDKAAAYITASWPPSTMSSHPLMNEASSEAKKA